MEEALRAQVYSVTVWNGRAVLILILMEDALRVFWTLPLSFAFGEVLILILMEDALRGLRDQRHSSI